MHIDRSLVMKREGKEKPISLDIGIVPMMYMNYLFTIYAMSISSLYFFFYNSITFLFRLKVYNTILHWYLLPICLGIMFELIYTQ